MVFKLLIIWVCWYFRYSMNACFFQFLKKANQPGIGILETAGIDKLYVFTNTIIKDAAKVQPLTESRPITHTIVFDDITINKPTAMTILSKVIVA